MWILNRKHLFSFKCPWIVTKIGYILDHKENLSPWPQCQKEEETFYLKRHIQLYLHCTCGRDRGSLHWGSLGPGSRGSALVCNECWDHHHALPNLTSPSRPGCTGFYAREVMTGVGGTPRQGFEAERSRHRILLTFSYWCLMVDMRGLRRYGEDRRRSSRKALDTQKNLEEKIILPSLWVQATDHGYDGEKIRAFDISLSWWS